MFCRLIESQVFVNDEIIELWKIYVKYKYANVIS